MQLNLEMNYRIRCYAENTCGSSLFGRAVGVGGEQDLRPKALKMKDLAQSSLKEITIWINIYC